MPAGCARHYLMAMHRCSCRWCTSVVDTGQAADGQAASSARELGQDQGLER